MAGLTLEDCQRIFKVSARTVRSWESGQTEPPHAVFLCLHMYSNEADFLGEKWRGFRFAPDGALVSPSGNFVWWYEVDALPYVYAAAGLSRSRTCMAVKNRQQQGETVKMPDNVLIFKKKAVNDK